jgi:uncharacterized glyoxalase superfamily protein PhnB
MKIQIAVPVLRVTDVARSLQFYHATIGFAGDPFPPAPPHAFAILRQGSTEIMLRRGIPPARPQPCPYDWDVYLRVEGGDFRALFAQCQSRGLVTRRLERMFYGLAEFEITDPDGYVVCLSQQLADMSDLPPPNV